MIVCGPWRLTNSAVSSILSLPVEEQATFLLAEHTSTPGILPEQLTAGNHPHFKSHSPLQACWGGPKKGPAPTLEVQALNCF
jgi:hypothetical protein